MRRPTNWAAGALMAAAVTACREGAPPLGDDAFAPPVVLTADSVARVTSFLAIDPVGRPGFVWV